MCFMRKSDVAHLDVVNTMLFIKHETKDWELA